MPVPVSTVSQGSTLQFAGYTDWSPQMHPGPFWNSYDQLKNSGSTALEKIKPNHVGTVATKNGIFRILRDADYHKLLGLAAEVHRIKTGVSFIVNVARVVQKHKDQDSINLLVQSVAMLGESRVLPEREGHDEFEISADEAAENSEQIDAAEIPRPAFVAK